MIGAVTESYNRGKNFNKLQSIKQKMKLRRNQNEQFTNEQWQKKVVPPFTHDNSKIRVNDGQLQNMIENNVKEHHCAKMKHICKHWHAHLYKDEVGSGKDECQFCCKQGKMKSKRNLKLPKYLKELFATTSELA